LAWPHVYERRDQGLGERSELGMRKAYEPVSLGEDWHRLG
jgi:hypothetical protein